MSTQTITIPAREVRPGDVLFGMTVAANSSAVSHGDRCFVFYGDTPGPVWTGASMKVTVDRPAPSDPPGTVRGKFFDGVIQEVYFKSYEHEGYWYADADPDACTDADVANFPILWKPGMPIPTEGVQA